MLDELSATYGNRVRVRVCGLLYEGDALLLVNHTLPGNSAWWAPPGGGVDFGESLEHALQREFEEETRLKISVHHFAFGCEFIQGTLHAIELFFWVKRIGGTLQTGQDPELPLIADVRFINMHEVAVFPRNQVHGIFHIARSEADLQQLKGFFRI